ncbi:MAG: serine/threonine protein kinase [Polyangiaceae bacterium]|nr:serine/threonine protein kinase [Polyangiaceae bacterium]
MVGPLPASGSLFAGDFRVLQPLSEGGMGKLFLVEQLSTGRQRALKLMQPHLVSDPKLRDRFVREARISASIESDHVAQVIGAGIEAGVPWIAMELLQGEDLATAAQRREVFERSEVEDIFAQLCHAVGAAHAAGIVHRDLKPENIFLSRSRRVGARFEVKVLDFGIAKLTAEATTSATQSVGTPLWMAPEQTSLGVPITPATDVWALGLIAYRLLIGAPYWRAAQDPHAPMMAVLREVLMDPIDPPSVRARERSRAELVPPGFDAWFLRCVNRSSRDRYADAGAAYHALAPLLLAPAPAAPPPMAYAAAEAGRSSTFVGAPLAASFQASAPPAEVVELELEPDSEGPATSRMDGLSAAMAPRSDALRRCQTYLERSPLDPQAGHTLVTLARERKDVDLAWRAATLLVVAGHATEEERRIAEPPRLAEVPRQYLDEGLWRSLTHSELDPLLSQVFAAVAPAFARATGSSPRPDAPRLDPSCRVDVRASHRLSHPLRAASLFLRIPEPALYVQPSHAQAITAVHGEPMAILVGAPLLVPLPPARVLFAIARYIAGLRKEVYLPLFIGSSSSMRAALGAIVALASGKAVPGDDPLATQVARAIASHLRPHEWPELKRATATLMATRETLDLRGTLRAAEITAARAALLLGGDLAEACQALPLSRPRELTVDVLASELCSFWISEAHGALRTYLGMARPNPGHSG